MPDFRAYIREHLPPLGASGAKEAEVIEELALDFEERYKSAIRGGLDPSEAWRKIQSQTEWPKPDGMAQAGSRFHRHAGFRAARSPKEVNPRAEFLERCPIRRKDAAEEPWIPA